MPDLLIELFSEEIPARMQARAREDLKARVTGGLVEAGLTYAGAGAFSTPRRLTLAIEGLTAESRPVREERKGPRADAPQAAIDGFLRATGLRPDQLERREDKKGGATLFAVIEKPGRAAPDIVAEVLEAVIREFPWPKSMRWGAGSLRWVRPLHSILCLLTDETGATVVPLEIEGIRAGNTTEGHRFMGAGRFAVHSFDDYAAKLRRAFVMLDPAEREAMIWNEAQTLAFAQGLEPVEDRALLAEIAGLVEWPVPLMGRIKDQFLHLPPEVLQTSMREHQKFFSVKNPRTGRIEGYVTVANIETPDQGATILKGNDKVLTARLSDARFFWENDLRVAKAGMVEWLDALMALTSHLRRDSRQEGKERDAGSVRELSPVIVTGMGEWLQVLRAVTFHSRLGSQHERVERIASWARDLAPAAGANPDEAERAAWVAKVDLRSAMVGEFPELQGLMGMYYAREAGLPEAVALAARDHYSPIGPSDAVPSEPVSVAVALADKLEMLTSFWAIDEKPTGSKDPFALRRAALGVIRLLVSNSVRIELLGMCRAKQTALLEELYFGELVGVSNQLTDVREAIEQKEKFGPEFPSVANAVAALRADQAKLQDLESEIKAKLADLDVTGSEATQSVANLLAFLHDRLKVYLKDQGIRHDVIDASLAMPGNDDLTLLVARATALSDLLKTEDGTNLLQGFKRANNILSQAEAKDGVEYSFGADPKFAETEEERALFAALDAAEAAIDPAMAAEDFPAAMRAMAGLRAPIDAFFTAVQINTDNPVIRRNRLNLLHRIRATCQRVADLTKIEG